MGEGAPVSSSRFPGARPRPQVSHNATERFSNKKRTRPFFALGVGIHEVNTRTKLRWLSDERAGLIQQRHRPLRASKPWLPSPGNDRPICLLFHTHVSFLQELQAEFVSFMFLPFLFSVSLHISARLFLGFPLFYILSVACWAFAFCCASSCRNWPRSPASALCAVEEELDCCTFYCNANELLIARN